MTPPDQAAGGIQNNTPALGDYEGAAMRRV
jgi:hypothetical protein